MPNTENPVFAKTAILQVLQEGPGYGSELVDRIKKLSKDAVTLSAGAIYPVLKAMEEEKLVVKTRTEGRTDIYRATPKGNEVAQHHKQVVADLFGLKVKPAKKPRKKATVEAVTS